MPAASPAPQRVRAPLDTAPASPHGPGRGETRWRRARAAPPRLCIVAAPAPPAPPPSSSDTQRRLRAPRAPAGRGFPAFVPPSLVVTVCDVRGMPHPRSLLPYMTSEKAGRTPRLYFVPLAGISSRFCHSKFCRWCWSGLAPSPPSLPCAGWRRPQTHYLSRHHSPASRTHPPSGSREQKRTHGEGERGEDGPALTYPQSLQGLPPAAMGEQGPRAGISARALLGAVLDGLPPGAAGI